MNQSKLTYSLLAATFLLQACQSFVKFQTANLGISGYDQQSVSGILSKPDGNGPFPAVVLLHTCGGLKKHVTDVWPNYLNDLGYVTLTVDTYGSRGQGRCPNYIKNDQIIFGMDAYGALDYLRLQPFVGNQKIAVMGFSAGGSAINGFTKFGLRKGRDSEFSAAVIMYGECSDLGHRGVPTMHIIGDKDRNAVCTILDKSSPYEVQYLKDTYHAFDQSRITSLMPDAYGNWMLYDGDAHAKAENFVKVFLAKHLK